MLSLLICSFFLSHTFDLFIRASIHPCFHPSIHPSTQHAIIRLSVLLSKNFARSLMICYFHMTNQSKRKSFDINTIILIELRSFYYSTLLPPCYSTLLPPCYSTLLPPCYSTSRLLATLLATLLPVSLLLYLLLDFPPPCYSTCYSTSCLLATLLATLLPASLLLYLLLYFLPPCYSTCYSTSCLLATLLATLLPASLLLYLHRSDLNPHIKLSLAVFNPFSLTCSWCQATHEGPHGCVQYSLGCLHPS